MNFSELNLTPPGRRRTHEPPEVVAADWADRVGGVQCWMVDQLPPMVFAGVLLAAAGLDLWMEK